MMEMGVYQANPPPPPPHSTPQFRDIKQRELNSFHVTPLLSLAVWTGCICIIQTCKYSVHLFGVIFIRYCGLLCSLLSNMTRRNVKSGTCCVESLVTLSISQHEFTTGEERFPQGCIIKYGTVLLCSLDLTRELLSLQNHEQAGLDQRWGAPQGRLSDVQR